LKAISSLCCWAEGAVECCARVAAASTICAAMRAALPTQAELLLKLAGTSRSTVLL
jgi:hypothetical protein